MPSSRRFCLRHVGVDGTHLSGLHSGTNLGIVAGLAGNLPQITSDQAYEEPHPIGRCLKDIGTPGVDCRLSIEEGRPTDAAPVSEIEITQHQDEWMSRVTSWPRLIPLGGSPGVLLTMDEVVQRRWP
jgi:hypothetical protein